ncbi:hypothetical protein B0H11DRAFT_2011977 [Mycena galericulata]|nr:hypothetical protein B0H11DRAFT_2011977 [Mycena galericulata]
MVLTRRQYRAISRWLPNEVILQVIDAAPKPDQAALCRVSKLFHRLATPAVYRDLELDQLTLVVDFCSAILSNPHLAELVRSVALMDVRVITPEAGLSGIILNALKNLLRLEHLSIPGGLLSDEDFDVFLQCTFPRLVSCDVDVGKTDDLLVSFLIRHTALAYVCLRGFYYTPPPHRILLPSLRHFHGSVHLIPQIEAIDLNEIGLTWYLGDEFHDVEPIFVALKSMTRNDTPLACCIFWSERQFTDIVDSLSRNVPQTQCLRMKMCHLTSREEKLACLKTCLPRFINLAFLSIESIAMTLEWDSGSPFWNNETEDLKAVEELGNLCSTLEACCLNSHAWRKMNGRWEKCTIREFRALAGIQTPSYEQLDFE